VQLIVDSPDVIPDRVDAYLQEVGPPLGDVGVLHGTTGVGGASNIGLVFSLTPTAGLGGTWTETVLHNFTGIATGGGPEGGVTIGGNGVIYGTTLSGGTGNCNSGCGTVFSLKR